MPKAATAPTPSRSVSLCSAPFLPCPPSLGASHLPFPSAPSFTPSPVADPAACLPIFTLVFGGLCVFGRRGRPHLFSLPTCYRDRRPQFAAGHARAAVPASHRPHDSKRTCCCSLLSFKTFCAAGACALAPGGHNRPATPRSFPGTRVPPSGALTVLHELFSSLGAEAVSEPGIWLWFSMQGLLRWLSPTCVNLQLDNGFPGTVFEVPLGSLTPCLIVSGFLILLQCRLRRSPASSCLVSSLALSA